MTFKQTGKKTIDASPFRVPKKIYEMSRELSTIKLLKLGCSSPVCTYILYKLRIEKSFMWIDVISTILPLKFKEKLFI